MRVLLTCEHGGNRIPAKYWPLFKTHGGRLRSHEGHDPGALALARDFARAFDAELVYSTTSRLLVELNRSHGHRQLFSDVTRTLPPEERQRLLERYYYPYREWVEAQVRERVERSEAVLHVSSHSFTPELKGEIRNADIGLLYDPKRRGEVELCRAWQAEIKALAPRLVVRRNYPYRGDSDGLTTYLRRSYPDPLYRGVEIEVNQKHTLGPAGAWKEMRTNLVRALQAAMVSCR